MANIHIAGICGTFMAGIAQIAQQLGDQVRGSDHNVYPPMSTLLEALEIPVAMGYQASTISKDTDCVVIGNALSRGNPSVEHVLNNRLAYQSGAQWLGDNVLSKRQVIAVAGTHGKTTTASMIAWILRDNGIDCGYLIGGKPGNFDHSAQLGSSPWFVIEADEYDTAFFDKRAKFVHYHPAIAVLNNLEFDHADIYPDLDAIKRQFHHLMRIVPQNGSVIVNAQDENLQDVLAMGNWSQTIGFSSHTKSRQQQTHRVSADWQITHCAPGATTFKVSYQQAVVGEVTWQLLGQHNVANALAAIAACHQAGVSAQRACDSLGRFTATARRLQRLFDDGNTRLFEDFAHHPSAIATTLQGLREYYPTAQLLAVVEPRSNTMQGRHHINQLGSALDGADQCILYTAQELHWQPSELTMTTPLHTSDTVQGVLNILQELQGNDTVIVMMSNGGFDGLPNHAKNWLEQHHSSATPSA